MIEAAELVALRWQQVDLKGGYLDVHRVKRGHNAKHPLRGPQLRLLRELQRTSPDSPYSRTCKVRGRTGDQVNKVIGHF
jgi:integrase